MSIGFPTAFLNSMTSPFEIGVVLVAILVLFGAKSLPGTLRTLGRWMEQLRRLSDDFRGQLMDMDQEVKSEFLEWDRDVEGSPVSHGLERPEPPPAPPAIPELDETGDVQEESKDGQ